MSDTVCEHDPHKWEDCGVLICWRCSTVLGPIVLDSEDDEGPKPGGLVEAFDKLREAVGGAWDGVDVLRWTCRERHVEGCPCTGVANTDMSFVVGDEDPRRRP